MKYANRMYNIIISVFSISKLGISDTVFALLFVSLLGDLYQVFRAVTHTLHQICPFMILLYFMSVRPQQKRAKELQDMMNNLEKGDEVIAASGILGKVKEIKGDYVAIEVSENITFKLQKNAISNTLPKGTIASINS